MGLIHGPRMEWQRGDGRHANDLYLHITVEFLTSVDRKALACCRQNSTAPCRSPRDDVSHPKEVIVAAQPHHQRPSSVFLVETAGGVTRPAPPWFVNWVRLGALAALGRLINQPGDRTVLAISTPVRSMAAAAFAFGYCRERYLDAPLIRCPSSLSRSLGDLERGAKIWLRLAERVLSGTYYGTLQGKRVHTSAGMYQIGVVREVRAIPSWVELPDGRYLLDELATTEHAFLAGMLRHRDPVEYITSWNWDLVLTGSPVRLHADMAERICPPMPGAVLGSLASIIRPLEISSIGERARIAGWRSVLMPSRSEEAVWSGWPEPPAVTVLDGAYAISRWLEGCKARLTVAIIDRSEPGLDAAVSVLEQERAYMKPIPMDGLGWEPPGGCELLAFGSRK